MPLSRLKVSHPSFSSNLNLVFFQQMQHHRISDQCLRKRELKSETNFFLKYELQPKTNINPFLSFQRYCHSKKTTPTKKRRRNWSEALGTASQRAKERLWKNLFWIWCYWLSLDAEETQPDENGKGRWAGKGTVLYSVSNNCTQILHYVF